MEYRLRFGWGWNSWYNPGWNWGWGASWGYPYYGYGYNPYYWDSYYGVVIIILVIGVGEVIPDIGEDLLI
jgi:hypothetical protein